MNNYEADGYNPYCYFHPKEVIVGICALCLRERLLNLASKQGNFPTSKDYSNRSFRLLRRRPKIALTKIFALGSFLGRLKSNHQEPDRNSDEVSIASLEDSFLSMKFEDNGQASWEDKKMAEIPNDVGKEMKRGGKSKVEHIVKAQRSSLRWQKRIGQLLHLARWKRSKKQGGEAYVAIASKVEGRRDWISSLTGRRRRTTDQ